MVRTQEHIKPDSDNIDNIEKIQSMFETRNEVIDDSDIKEFIYADEEDDPEGNWWLILSAICAVWVVLGTIGTIKVVQWTIQLISSLLK